MIQLDIISDPVCPWCYIGKVRLDRALAAARSNPFRIVWRMFRLNPDMPAEGMDRRAYLDAKFGGPAGTARVYGAVDAAGRAEGIDWDLDRIGRAPQTLDAHRLIRWAAAEGAEQRVADAIFRAYFHDGQDISDHDTLVQIGASCGMDAAILRHLLAGDADRAELEAEEAEARQMGVTGVPCFVIGGRHVVQGAQESDTWGRIIAELAALDARMTEAAR
ncbi:DsbA family oxidoreductase [Limibaculum sp. FT325]|uniref:DsbA family oxidoreductase n=1 Tax=Thermohalobaculum sediminis TaxID=2939436 RepID=UPI0020BE404B|nr:DsbA family oxidoreductase [Limibaculum sediminis]MCL5775522.1 DsbA family oxidoreductase [Limibaculum sediminis]